MGFLLLKKTVVRYDNRLLKVIIARRTAVHTSLGFGKEFHKIVNL